MSEKRVEPFFNAIYDTYDRMEFLRKPAERLVVNAKIHRGQRVLDVACGSGWATMAAARAVGDNGRVTGIDISDKLLNVARGKTASAGLLNTEYHVENAEALEFSDASFDAVICASSIMIITDKLKALREWRRVSKAGGIVAFSSFGENLLQPLNTLFNKRLTQYDKQAPPSQQPGERTDTPDSCGDLLKRAGFEEIETCVEQLGYFVQDANAWWREVSSTPSKLRLNRLSQAELEKFKAEHLSEVESLRVDQGIRIEVPVIFSIATK
jgi:arsenite methyltransferase